MTLTGSTLTLFDVQFQMDQYYWHSVKDLFSSRYNSMTKQEDVSDELGSLRLSFRKEIKTYKETLTKRHRRHNHPEITSLAVRRQWHDAKVIPLICCQRDWMGSSCEARWWQANKLPTARGHIICFNQNHWTAPWGCQQTKRTKWHTLHGSEKVQPRAFPCSKRAPLLHSRRFLRPTVDCMKLHNCCSNYWPLGCSVRSCKKARDNERIRRNLEAWRRMSGFPAKASHFADISSAYLEPDKSNGHSLSQLSSMMLSARQ